MFPAKAMGKTEKEGKIWGFISAWGYIISNIIAVAFSAIYVATYMGVGFEALANLQIPLAIAAVILVTILNLMKITDAGKFNNILVGGLIITMVLYVCIAFFSGTWSAANFSSFFSQGAMGTTGFITAIPNAMVGYGSVVAIAFLVSV